MERRVTISLAALTLVGSKRLSGNEVTMNIGYIVTAWHAPDFGCEIIKLHVDFGTDKRAIRRLRS